MTPADDAPPGEDPPDEEDAGPVCPFCGAADAEPHSRFGSEVSAEQWYCRSCRTVFERLRYDGKRPGTGRDHG